MGSRFVEDLRSSGILTELGRSIKGLEKNIKHFPEGKWRWRCEKTRLEARLFSLRFIFTYKVGGCLYVGDQGGLGRTSDLLEMEF